MNVKTLATQIWPSALVLLLPFQVSVPGTLIRPPRVVPGHGSREWPNRRPAGAASRLV